MDETTDIPSALGDDTTSLDEAQAEAQADVEAQPSPPASAVLKDRWALALRGISPRKRSKRLLPVALVGVLLVAFSGVLLAGGSGVVPSGSAALAPTATALDTATPTATDTATATATATAKPTATLPPVKYQPPKVVKGGGGTPPPPPPPPGVPAGPSPTGGVPNIGGQVVLVNIAQQWLWIYQDRTLIYDTPVTTGMPELATPTEVFTIRWRETNIWFYSPWPTTSPYYYTPEHIDYAMYFADDGYFIHNASWRQCFGPGTNVPHTCPDGDPETGSHGCVNVPTTAGAWLYAHTHDGATVDIIDLAPPPTPTPTPTQTPTPSPSPVTTDTVPPTDTPSPTGSTTP
jgi:lipoprotein-anchoring transpeptidase ErfK/SrfK